MSCLYPIKIQPKTYRCTSKERTVITADCRKCPPCRAKQAREWTKRMKDELTLHPYASFVTLTYADKCLPAGGNLHYPDVQSFLKRLRIAISRDKTISIKKIRFFVCGEYGPSGTHRPHYHAIIFGLNPGIDDKTLSNLHVPIASFFSPSYFRAQNAQWRATTELVKKAWDRGRVDVQSASVGTIGYVANYLQKKDVYVPFGKFPPFHRQSTNPGLGYGYAKKWQDEIVNKGTYMVMKSPGILALPNTKSTPLNLPYPSYYYRKMLTDEQKEQRRLDMITKTIGMYTTSEEIKYLGLKTPDELQEFIANRKLNIQRSRDCTAQAKQRLFGDSNARLKLDYHEQTFGLPSGNYSDSPTIIKDKRADNVILTKKQKLNLVPKIREAFSSLKLNLDVNTEDLTWSERELLEKAQRRARIAVWRKSKEDS